MFKIFSQLFNTKGQMSVNQRIKILVDTYSGGIVSKFAKELGVSHTSIASMMPDSRESKPGYEIIAKILETFPEISSDWLIKGEGDMRKEKSTSSQYASAGRDIGVQAGGSVTQSGSAPKSDCEKDLEAANREIERLEKYVARLERMLDMEQGSSTK